MLTKMTWMNIAWNTSSAPEDVGKSARLGFCLRRSGPENLQLTKTRKIL